MKRTVKEPAKANAKLKQIMEFNKILKEATEAANAAGDKWVVEHTKPVWSVRDGANREVGQLLDVCGFGFIQVKDKRSAFVKYIKEIQNGYDSTIQINSKYRMRQEWSLNEATAYAALKVLQDHGIKGLSVYSRID